MPEQIIPNFGADFAGGINLRDAPIGLGPGELILSENMEPIASGLIRGRAGQSELNGTQIDANPIRSLYRFYRQNGVKFNIATSGTKIYKISDAGVIVEIDAAYTADKKFSFVNWNTKDLVYWINDNEVLKSWDGTTVATVGGSPPVGSMVELHDDRLWILRKTLVNFSGLNVDNSWPGANALNLVDRYGGEGKFIKSFGRGLLVIAKDSGLYRFEGSPGLGGKLTRFSDIGCVAPWSASVSPAGVIFLAVDGFYITNGFEVTAISQKLDPLFTLPLRTSVGQYYPKKRQYYWSFSATNAVNDDLYIATALDTPNGQRVSWNRQTGFKAESFAVWGGPADTGELYYGRADLGKVRRADTGAQDVGVDYISKFQTAWFDLGDKFKNKQIRWLYPIFESLRPVTYQVGYTFGKEALGGQMSPNSIASAVWGPGTPVWGPGTVVWSAVPPTTATKQSVIFLASGRHFGFTFQNSDGPNFEMYGLGYEAKLKPARHFEPFAITSQA